MIFLFPIGQVITYIAVGYSLLPIMILYFTWPLDNSQTIYAAARTALAGSGVLSMLLYFSFMYGWRLIWRLFPQLNVSMFPDLNGSWKMRIDWNRDEESGVKVATAVIRQNFLKISMEVHSEDSDSETHLAQPKKDPESGSPTLFYVYRVTPKQTAGAKHSPYNGSAKLRLSATIPMRLSGNYFTDAGSQGHFELTKSSVRGSPS